MDLTRQKISDIILGKDTNRIFTMENKTQDHAKEKFRELYYTSLLEQRKENESNRIKIAIISIGLTIAGLAGLVGTIIGTGKPISNPFLLLLLLPILLIGYIPWLNLLYVLFRKLEIDDKVIDEKIATIGTPKEYADTKSQSLADELEGKFRWWLIVAIIGIIAMPILILISTLFIKGDDEVSKSRATEKVGKVVEKIEKVVVDTTNTKDPNFDKSAGGKLPGFFQQGDTQSDNPPDTNQEGTSPQSIETENQNTNEDAKTEEKQ